MKKQILAVATAALVSVMSFVPAFAQQGSVTVGGGSLSVSPAAITIAPVTLNGTARIDIAGTTTAWTVTDATGLGDGWHVNIAATNFTHTVDSTRYIPLAGFDAQLLSGDIDTADGNEPPTTSMGSFTVLTVEAQALASAALGKGMGTYTLLPTFQLDVPAATYAGSYVSTVTISSVSAP